MQQRDHFARYWRLWIHPQAWVWRTLHRVQWSRRSKFRKKRRLVWKVLFCFGAWCISVLVRNAFFFVALLFSVVFFDELTFFLKRFAYFLVFFLKKFSFFFLESQDFKEFFVLKPKISEVFCLKSWYCRPLLPVFLGNRFNTPYFVSCVKMPIKNMCNHFYTILYKNTIFLLSHSSSVFFFYYL